MNHAVIMAGGIGTRFWPGSRRARPKQFLPIAGARPMIAETVGRLDGVVDPERVLVVTRSSQVDLVREACPEVPAANVLAEPVGRSTAPCIALAALKLREADPDAVMLCLPADHVIRPAEAFRRAAAFVLERARTARSLLTFGIPPTEAATGFGYIERAERLHEEGGLSVRRVARFVEKPDRQTARGYLASGRFLWNSGMFAWRADVILEHVTRLVPGVVDALAPHAAGAGPEPTPELARAYEALPDISIDHGVMEKAEGVEVVPATFEWDDVGSWRALDRLHRADAHGNVAVGPLLALDSEGIIAVTGEDHVVAALGVHNLVVVHTDDVTLVCPKDRVEEVKRLVEILEERGHGELA